MLCLLLSVLNVSVAKDLDFKFLCRLCQKIYLTRCVLIKILIKMQHHSSRKQSNFMRVSQNSWLARVTF